MRKFGTIVALAAALLVASCARAADFIGMKEVSPQALQRAATDPRVEAFYEARQWQPAWSSENTGEFLETLQGAEKHGMNADKFLAIIGEAKDPAREEAALTLAAIAYAEALSDGMADPKKIWSIYTVARPKTDVVAGLAQALEGGDLETWFDSLAPQDEDYQVMSAAYMALRKQMAERNVQPIPAGAAIKPGGQDPRMPQIAQALHMAGFFPGPVDPEAMVYTPAMVPGVKVLQGQAGLKADGTIGAQTLAALNSVAADHAQQLAINMERRRWLPREAPAARVDVNTAAAFLNYYRGGNLAHTARVVVGKRGTETPQLQSNMFQLVANPPWNVPAGIAAKEIFPKGAGYLASQNMYVQNGRIIQRPGPKAALGVVKFDLKNPYAIYLHDTPSKSLFASDMRHRSHGCVRVHNAVDFARMLANEHGILGEFDRKMASGDTGAVTLKEQIPVRLLYHTVYLDDAGRLVYLPDPYGWDQRLAKAVGLTAPQRARPDADVAIELGP
ncbi:MAG TPA: L,D-transpeptidase family protein [Arenibaculum sp.]|nr:L,D-transpeptidase family protein [Arenibaculum sp.]